MNIKTLSSSLSVEDLDTKIQKWKDSLPPIEIVSANVTGQTLHDYYQNSAPPMLCNQWQEFIAVIIYHH